MQVDRGTRGRTLVAGLAGPGRWLRRAVRENGVERETLAQAAKTALAVAVAWLIADLVLPGPLSFAAPYAAIYVMNDTIYRSVTGAAQQLLALAVGILLAYAATELIHNRYAALGAAVFVAVFAGRWRHFGGNGSWVPVTALVMLTYGTAAEGGYLLERIGQSAIGAAIGVAVNLLVLPPIHLQRAHWAIHRLSRDLAALLRSLAEGVRTDPTPQDARDWLERARSVQATAREAQEAIGKGEESVRFNPRRGLRHRRDRLPVPSAHRPAVGALQVVAEQCQRIGDILLSEAESDGARPAPDPVFGDALAGLLDELAEAVEAYQRTPERPDGVPERLRADLDRLHEEHERITHEVREGSIARPASWSVQGGLIIAVERAASALLAGAAATGPA